MLERALWTRKPSYEVPQRRFGGHPPALGTGRSVARGRERTELGQQRSVAFDAPPLPGRVGELEEDPVRERLDARVVVCVGVRSRVAESERGLHTLAREIGELVGLECPGRSASRAAAHERRVKNAWRKALGD